LDFLEDWPAFVQKLSNIFGSYSSKDNDEDTIVYIPFPSDGKAIDYFIYFTKYQNHICWDKRALCKVVKDAIPNCICNELCYSQEDVLSFEGFKRAVLCIDNDYWKRIHDDKNKLQTSRSPQYQPQKVLRSEPTRPLETRKRANYTKQAPRYPSSLGNVPPTPPPRPSISNLLEVDG